MKGKEEKGKATLDLVWYGGGYLERIYQFAFLFV